MKRTQKQTIETVKNVRVNVLSFDSVTERRSTSYGEIDPITALQEVARRTAEGKKVLILNPDKDTSIRWEIQNKQRIPWIEALKMVVESNNPLFKY